ncbi:hypothetical protein KIPB_003071, partial [Kipferlia bialata]
VYRIGGLDNIVLLNSRSKQSTKLVVISQASLAAPLPTEGERDTGIERERERDRDRTSTGVRSPYSPQMRGGYRTSSSSSTRTNAPSPLSPLKSRSSPVSPSAGYTSRPSPLSPPGVTSRGREAKRERSHYSPESSVSDVRTSRRSRTDVSTSHSTWYERESEAERERETRGCDVYGECSSLTVVDAASNSDKGLRPRLPSAWECRIYNEELAIGGVLLDMPPHTSALVRVSPNTTKVETFQESLLAACLRHREREYTLTGWLSKGEAGRERVTRVILAGRSEACAYLETDLDMAVEVLCTLCLIRSQVGLWLAQFNAPGLDLEREREREREREAESVFAGSYSSISGEGERERDRTRGYERLIASVAMIDKGLLGSCITKLAQDNSQRHSLTVSAFGVPLRSLSSSARIALSLLFPPPPPTNMNGDGERRDINTLNGDLYGSAPGAILVVPDVTIVTELVTRQVALLALEISSRGMAVALIAPHWESASGGVIRLPQELEDTGLIFAGEEIFSDILGLRFGIHKGMKRTGLFGRILVRMIHSFQLFNTTKPTDRAGVVTARISALRLAALTLLKHPGRFVIACGALAGSAVSNMWPVLAGSISNMWPDVPSDCKILFGEPTLPIDGISFPTERTDELVRICGLPATKVLDPYFPGNLFPSRSALSSFRVIATDRQRHRTLLNTPWLAWILKRKENTVLVLECGISGILVLTGYVALVLRKKQSRVDPKRSIKTLKKRGITLKLNPDCNT